MRTFLLSLALLFSVGAIKQSWAQQHYEHFIIYGQSLSTGHQSYPSLTLENLEGNYMLGNQIWYNFDNSGEEILSPLVSTIDGTTLAGTAIIDNRAAATRAENALTGAVNHLRLKTDDESHYIATSCGVGGKTIEQLSKGSYQSFLYECFMESLEGASGVVQKEQGTIACPALFWMQGEQNYLPNYPGYKETDNCTTDKDEYKEWFIQMKNNMQEDVIRVYRQEEKPLFITYQAGCQYIKNTEVTVGMAQVEASNEYEDIICAGPVYQMTDRGGHLDSNGYRWFGEMLGKVYYKTKILGEDFKPLQPEKIYRTDNPKEIKIDFLVPVLPLVLDDYTTALKTQYGFEVYVGKARRTLRSVEVEGNTVTLTCTANLTGEVSVIYAGQLNGGHGNLRDSDDYEAFYNYIDLDGKNEDGSWIFERDVAETTLRPTYEPHNVEGDIIYNQPYPLYNFCVSFYHKLEADQNELIIYDPEEGNSIKEVSTKKLGDLIKKGDIVYFESELKGECLISYIDVSGRVLKKTIMEKTESVLQLPLEISSPNNLYLLRLELSGYSWNMKVML